MESNETPVAPPSEVKTFTVEDEKDEYLPALLAEMDKRLLTPEDFPEEGEPLEWHEQRQLIEKSLELAARKPAGTRERLLLEDQANMLAIPCGFVQERWRGRMVWGLKRWLLAMAKAHP